jgi:hypothetical protein
MNDMFKNMNQMQNDVIRNANEMHHNMQQYHQYHGHPIGYPPSTQQGFPPSQPGYPPSQFGQASAQPDHQSFPLLNLNHYSPLVSEFREDVFYRNGKKKYDSFHKHFFFENGTKAYDGFHNHAFYADNGVKAFDGFHGHVMYHNGKQAYDGFFYKAKYENGNDLGKSGLSYRAENVSMVLRENVHEFEIYLGEDFRLWVAIGENSRSKHIRLYIGYQCVLDKNL